MRYKVINLARTPERLYQFKKVNPNFKFERFDAVDGRRLDRNKLVSDGLITAACAARYTAGALGVALSHRQLWVECAESGVNYTILEDDAWLVPDFNNLVQKYTVQNIGWDFIFWGANFDQRLVVELSPNIAAAEVKYNFDGVLQNIHNIQAQTLTPKLFRTWWAVGLVCYTLRPPVAEYLLKSIFPLRDYFEWRDNHGIDNSIIEELANMNALISLPPVALTLNDRYNSTVQENKQ